MAIILTHLLVQPGKSKTPMIRHAVGQTIRLFRIPPYSGRATGTDALALAYALDALDMANVWQLDLAD